LLQGTSLVQAVTRVTRPATRHPRHRTLPPATPPSGLPTTPHPQVTPPHNHVCVNYYITRRFYVVLNFNPALFLNLTFMMYMPYRENYFLYKQQAHKVQCWFTFISSIVSKLNIETWT